jgi:signal transduction histidine kinase
MLILLALGILLALQQSRIQQIHFADLALRERTLIEHTLITDLIAHADHADATTIATRDALAFYLRTVTTEPAAHALADSLDALAIPISSSTAQIEARAAAEHYRNVQIAQINRLEANLSSASPFTLFLLMALLGSSSVVLLLIWLFRVGLLKPLVAISGALQAVSTGDLTPRMPRRVPREFQPVVAAYQQMIQTLSERQLALDEQLRRTATLTRLSIELRETLDPDIIAARVLGAISAELHSDEIVLLLLDPAGNPLKGYRWHQEQILPADAALLQLRSDVGVEGWAWRTGRSAAIADVATHSLWQAGGGPQTGSALVLPIRQHGTSLGSISLHATQTNHFTSRDLVLLEGIAAQMGVALSAAQRYHEERERRKQAMALLHTSQFLAVERDWYALVALFNEQCQAIFGASHSLLYLNDAPDGSLVALADARTHLPPTLRELADSAANAAHTDSEIVIRTEPQRASGDTCLGLPLVYAGETLGAAVIIRPSETGASFPANLWSLLTIFTGLIATATANMRLIGQLRQSTTQLAQTVAERTDELRQSRDLLRLVFDNLPEGLLLMRADGTLLAANNAFCRSIAGRRPQEIVGHGYHHLWHELAHQSDLQLEPQRPHDGQGAPLLPQPGEPFASTAATWRVLGTDFVGQQRWYAVERTPISRTFGQVEQFLERWRDITHQEELQRRMLLHEQLTSLGRLAASVAHEVGNPLQSAMSCLELCREDRSLSERSLEYLELALGELERMGRTLESLRNLYRPPQLAWEQIDLNRVIEQVIQFTQRQFQRARVKVDLHLEPHLPLIWGQPDAVRQVLLNLLLNAQEAMPKGGTISITSRRKTTDRLCEISIRDTGIGMGPEQIAHVFEPFRSNKAQGVGIGLTLSRQIMEQHNGHINIHSEINQGTTVVLHIPWIDDTPDRSPSNLITSNTLKDLPA